MAKIATHPYTKGQKSRPIPIPELKNCNPSEWHLRTRHFLGVNPPGKVHCQGEKAGHKRDRDALPNKRWKTLLTSTLSIFHSFPATYHLALLMVHIFHSSLDMHDAAHTMRISNIATSACLISFCHKAIEPRGLRSLSRNFMADIRISLRNTRGQSM